MEYFSNKLVKGDFDEVLSKTTEAFKQRGYGVITEVNMHDKLKEKLGVDIKKYKILGMCNPAHAYNALQAEENIGLFLPCKVLVKEIDAKSTEVVVINTETVMNLLGNTELDKTGKIVSSELNKALEQLG